MYVKILKAVDDLEIGKTYEVDDADGAAYIEAGQAEATEFEESPDLAGAIKEHTARPAPFWSALTGGSLYLITAVLWAAGILAPL